MTISSSDSTERHSFDTFMRPSLATNLTARRALGYERTTRLDWSGRVILQQFERVTHPRSSKIAVVDWREQLIPTLAQSHAANQAEP